MRDFIDVLLPSVSGTIATMEMTGKPLLGFSGAEGGGCKVAVVAWLIHLIIHRCLWLILACLLVEA